MLHAGNEKGLENQDSLLKDNKTIRRAQLLLQLLFTTVVDLIISFFVLKKISAKVQNRRKCQILIEKGKRNLKLIS